MRRALHHKLQHTMQQMLRDSGTAWNDIFIYTCIYIYMYMYLCIHIFARTSLHIYIYSYTNSVTNIVYTHISASDTRDIGQSWNEGVNMYTYTHTCIHIYTYYIYVYIYIYMHIYIFTCIYVYIYLHVHLYIYIYVVIQVVSRIMCIYTYGVATIRRPLQIIGLFCWISSLL